MRRFDRREKLAGYKNNIIAPLSLRYPILGTFIQFQPDMGSDFTKGKIHPAIVENLDRATATSYYEIFSKMLK